MPAPKPFTIALIVSRFNSEITEKLLEGAMKRLQELDFQENQIQVYKVPGAVEIPIVAQRLAKFHGIKAIVCLGAVIRGETDHYRYVCEQVSFGCQKVALENEIPVVFGILTTDTEEQAYDRIGGKHGHKGIESVDTAVEMVELLSKM